MWCIHHFLTEKTYPELALYPLRLVLKGSAAPIQLIVVGGDVVLSRPGRLVPYLIVDQAWEVLPAQKTQDAVDLAFVSTATDDSPTSAKVIKRKY